MTAVITALAVMTAGARETGLTKLGVTPGGGGIAGVSDGFDASDDVNDIF